MVISNEFCKVLRTTNPEEKTWITQALKVHRSPSTHNRVPHSLHAVFAEAEMDMLLNILSSENLTLKLGQTANEFMRFKTDQVNLGGGYQFTTMGSQIKELLKFDSLRISIEEKRPDLFSTSEAKQELVNTTMQMKLNLNRLVSSKFLHVAMGEHGAANMNYCIKTALGMMASPATPFPTE